MTPGWHGDEWVSPVPEPEPPEWLNYVDFIEPGVPHSELRFGIPHTNSLPL